MTARIRKLLSLLARPGFWPALRIGVAPTVEHGGALDRFEFAAVLDVGANKGQFAAYAAHRWPSAQVECFEPLPGPRARLSAILQRYARGRSSLHAVACGANSGSAQMHVATREDSSSLLPLGERQKAMFGMEEAQALTVPVQRLDEIVASGIPRPALLKIDVQGFEYEVLEGATKLLPHIDVVYVEASFVELYQGQRYAADVTSLLLASAFEAAGEFNVCTAADGSAVQADMLFVRRREIQEAA